MSASDTQVSRGDVVRFAGWASCRRDGEGPLGLLLVGTTVERPGEPVQMGFAAVAPSDLPEALEDVVVTRVGPRAFRISSGARSWTVEGVAHLHREVAGPFYRAIPPRPVPFRKRLFWRVLLALAGNSLSRRLLLR